MYLHLGQDTVVRTSEIIGIFDMDNATVGKSTRQFLAQAEKRGQVVNVTGELPKTFVVCRDKRGEVRVYISQISSATLRKRTGFIDQIANI
ncbi:extracellular matrix regulator RemB [Angelakisella massiliensis]|uniref:extracellular matrix regulator RemB n=1 Tax=Angelakisella massiliensis TaxID=1871018 RepID=UPI0008F8AE9D|nr:extracellular matrix/biofilm biosynthesis regulator RemA family protein [Angelakisella massiliensis]